MCSWTCAMKIAQASRLIELITAIMHRAGCDADEAATVARRLVDANLVGHDSHGVLRVGKYLEWMRVGWLNVRRDAIGHRIIWADADELRRLQELHQLPRTWANKARLAELKKPKQRPAR